MYTHNSLYEENLYHIKNMWIKQLCNHNAWDFATASRVRKPSGTFEKRAPGLRENEGETVKIAQNLATNKSEVKVNSNPRLI